MEITTKQFKRTDLVKITGRVDSATAPELEKELKSIMDQGRYRIVVDMSDLDFMSSAGIRVLVATAKAARRWNRGDVCLAALPPRIMDTFQLAGLTHVFKIYTDPIEAVGNL